MTPCRLGFFVLPDLTVCSESLKTATALNRLPHYFNRIQAVRLFILLFCISNREKTPFSIAMASSSSSASSGLSFQSISSRESTPEVDVAAMHDVLAPEWWDGMDWGFDAQSEDDEPQTDGEDNLQFLVDGELEEESDDDLISWGEDISSDEEEEPEDDTSSDEYPPMKRFRARSEDDDDDEEDEEEARAEGFTSSDEDTAGSSADGSEDGGDEGSDGSNGAGF